VPNKFVNYKNRGMFLEHIINDSNTYYLSKDIAVIYKKPTPIKVLNVSYRSKKTTLIDKAVFSETSTLDYNGVYKAKYIEFDAKESKSTTSFPLNNIKAHQITHIRNIINHGGIINTNTRKSIPYEIIEKKGHIIKEGYIPRLDYISTLDKIYFKES